MADVETLKGAQSKLARAAGRLNARNARGHGLPPIVLMTDDTRDADWVNAVRTLPAGSAVIVRNRDSRLREKLAFELRAVCGVRRIKLLVADDPALALRVRAWGVHLPQRRADKITALKARYPHWLITAAAHDERSAGAAWRSGADAILIAPVFPTASHPGRAGLGVVRLSAIAVRAGPAVYALGGIDAEAVQRLAATPLSGIALIGGWVRR